MNKAAPIAYHLPNHNQNKSVVTVGEVKEGAWVVEGDDVPSHYRPLVDANQTVYGYQDENTQEVIRIGPNSYGGWLSEHPEDTSDLVPLYLKQP